MNSTNSATMVMVKNHQHGSACVHDVVHNYDNTCTNNKIKVAVPLEGLSSSRSSLCGFYGRMFMENYGNFKASRELGRIMYYENRSWVDYPEEVVAVLKLQFVKGNPVVNVEVEGRNCLLDFYRMLEYELGSASEKSIAWIDISGNCFFPKVFVNNRGAQGKLEEYWPYECPKIEIEIKISESSGNIVGKKKREDEKSEGYSSNSGAKKRRIEAPSEVEKPRWGPKVRLVKEGEKGYSLIRKYFLSGMAMADPGARITRIYRCARTGHIEKARREIYEKQLEICKKARGDANVVLAWYGGSAKDIESILGHGFGMVSEVSGVESHGAGVYLSPLQSPQYSAMLSKVDSNGEKHMVLCRVILGKCEKVEVGSAQTCPSSVDFDSGVDHLTNPKWYVVWSTNMNTHVLPECVVSYRPADLQPGNCTPQIGLWSLLAKLLPKLKSSLPPSKLQEMRTLCRSYKDGQLGKQVFLKQLRSLVGDKILRSTIQEIRG